MPNADKCYLIIPFKEAAKGLDLDDEGLLTPTSLKEFGSREFENYKSIERRINDPECNGGCCAQGFSRSMSIGGTLSAGSSTTLLLGTASYDFYTSASGDTTFQAGMWSLSLYLAVVFGTTTVTGYVRVGQVGNGTDTGGRLEGGATFTGYGSTTDGSLSAVGGWYSEAAWAPAITLTNGTNRSITSASGTLTGMRFCDPCAPVVIEPGGG